MSEIPGGRQKAKRSNRGTYTTTKSQLVNKTTSPRTIRRRANSGRTAEGTAPRAARRILYILGKLEDGTELSHRLGMSRGFLSQVSFGHRELTPEGAKRLLEIDACLLRVMRIWEAKAATDWLRGSNDYLDGARPLDVLVQRGPAEVNEALEVAMA